MSGSVQWLLLRSLWISHYDSSGPRQEVSSGWSYADQINKSHQGMIDTSTRDEDEVLPQQRTLELLSRFIRTLTGQSAFIPARRFPLGNLIRKGEGDSQDGLDRLDRSIQSWNLPSWLKQTGIEELEVCFRYSKTVRIGVAGLAHEWSFDDCKRIAIHSSSKAFRQSGESSAFGQTNWISGAREAVKQTCSIYFPRLFVFDGHSW